MSKTLRLTIILLVIANIIAIAIYQASHRKTIDAQKSNDIRVANAISASSTPMMDKDEYLKIEQIDHQIGSTDLSKDDFEWVLGLLHGQHKPTDAEWFVDAQACGILASIDPTKVNSADENRIYETVSPLLSYKDTVSPWRSYQIYQSTPKIWAIAVMRHYKDKRAVPQLLDLLNDQDASVQRTAKDGLTAIGYNIEKPH